MPLPSPMIIVVIAPAVEVISCGDGASMLIMTGVYVPEGVPARYRCGDGSVCGVTIADGSI